MNIKTDARLFSEWEVGDEQIGRIQRELRQNARELAHLYVREYIYAHMTVSEENGITIELCDQDTTTRLATIPFRQEIYDRIGSIGEDHYAIGDVIELEQCRDEFHRLIETINEHLDGTNAD